jgi:hypothetical protein
MKNMRLSLILLMTLSLGLNIYLFYQKHQFMSENNNLQQEVAEIKVRYDSILQKSPDPAPEITSAEPQPFGPVLNDLQSRPELIPAKGNLGGNMYFISDSFQLLGKNWVYAAYEDGHKMGEAVFSYKKSGEGKYQWEVLVSRMY